MMDHQSRTKALRDATSIGFAIRNLADILHENGVNGDLEALESSHLLGIALAIKHLGHELAYGELANLSAELESDLKSDTKLERAA